ncbi:MAG TPA: FAD-dependent oxidoreductase [Negativicutes bacterium]
MDKILLEKNEIMIDGEYDVIVVGGGIAGVSAALASKRKGCSTLLIEKSVMLGGLATLGVIAIYLPLCDGKGRKIVGGISEELLKLSIKYGYDNLPPEWASGIGSPETKARYRTNFSPPEFVIAIDELMEKEGIDILYDTAFSSAIMEDGNCQGIIVENKSGRKGYSGKMVVDTTGDADVMVRAGAPCTEADNWLSYWAYTTNLDKMKEAVEKGDVSKGILLKWWGGINTGEDIPKEFWGGSDKDAASAPINKKYIGTDAREVTKYILDGRKLLKNGLDKAHAKSSSLLALPGMAQFRTTRRICGFYELAESDIFTHFEDSIGCTGDWRKAGPIFEIPYRTLISPGIKNIITAGRSIASKGDAWEVTRVIPPASMTGQAAGTAAALAVLNGCNLDEVAVENLQQELSATGVLIHF